MSNVFAVNQRVRLSVAFANSAGAATDPTTVALKYKNPGGGIATKTYALAEVIKDSTGNYHYDVDVTLAGRWFYRFEGAGALVAAHEAAFMVSESVF
jgi:hypothetical protein